MCPAIDCINLLIVAVDTYDIEKPCLKFKDSILFFELGDGLRIVGIPIDGKPDIEKNVNKCALC